MLISFPFKISGFLLIKTLEKTFPLEGTDYVDKKQAKQEYHLCLCSQNQIPKSPSLLGILKAERNVLYMFPVSKSLPPLLESGFFAVSLLHRGDETFLFHIVLKESANEVSQFQNALLMKLSRQKKISTDEREESILLRTKSLG